MKPSAGVLAAEYHEKSVAELKAGKGIAHELIEVDDE